MEWKILALNEVKANNNTFRIDAEFFKKEYLKALKLIKKSNFEFLDAITDWITQGPNPIFCETGIPCLTGRNINKGEVTYNSSDYVDQGEYERLKGYQIKKGDTLITLKGKGSIGKIGYVFRNKKAIFSRNIGIIRPNKINPAYLNIFIQCKYGKKIIDRGETGGTGQSTLTTSYLKAITIPRFKLETKIGDLLNEVELLKQQSNNIYLKAHSLLLSELGLTNWQPKHQLTFVKNYSDTGQAGRIDAESFQPKYEKIVKVTKNYADGWDLLGNRVNLKDKNFNPKDKTKYKYIELANISGNGEITDCMIEDGEDLPSRARRKVATGDVIVSSIGRLIIKHCLDR